MEAKSTESAGFYDFLAWLDANWKKVLIGVVLLLVAIAAFGIHTWNKKQSETEASKALMAVPTTVEGQRKAASPDDFLKVAQQHPNTAAGERAQLLAAGAAFEKRDYAKAQSQFDAVFKSSKENAVKSQAAFGIAACIEAQGNLDQAAQKYQDVAKLYSGESVAAQAKLATARIFEAQNKPEQAHKIYSDIENSKTELDMWKGDAAERRDRLESSHPELKKASSALSEQIIEVTTPPANE